MASDIRGSPQSDRLIQSEINPGDSSWTSAYGLEGDDYLGWLSGNVEGGEGNDVIQNLAPNNRTGVGAAYWSSPRGIYADLTKQEVLDGWGGTDRLIDVYKVFGSSHQDTLLGSEGRDWFDQSEGGDWIDGKGGNDTYWVSDATENLQVTLLPDTGAVKLTWHYRWSPDKPQSATLQNIESIFFQGSSQTPSKTVALESLIDWRAMARDALMLAGDLRWNAQSSKATPITLSFGFVNQVPAEYASEELSGFEPLQAEAREAIRAALAEISSFSLIEFVELSDQAASATLRFGASQQSNTRGFAYPPPSAAEMLAAAKAGTEPPAASAASKLARAGDVWLDVDTVKSITPEARWVMLHEIGHALGLADEGLDWQALGISNAPQGLNDYRFTVMAQSSVIQGIYPQGFARIDIDALQALYGVRPLQGSTPSDRASAGQVLALSAENTAQILTILPKAYPMTLDASALDALGGITGVALYLGDEARSSSAGMNPWGGFNTGNIVFAYGARVQTLIGTTADDVLVGDANDNRFEGRGCNDYIDGGAGTDWAVFSQAMGGMTLAVNNGFLQVSEANAWRGTTSLTGIEFLAFADGSVGVGSDANDRLSATSQAPWVLGFAGADSLIGSAASDTLDGGEGWDVALYPKAASQYRLIVKADGVALSDLTDEKGVPLQPGAAAPVDWLTNVETLVFADRSVEVARQSHASYADLPDTLYQFFVVGFGAAPGVHYMEQMAQAYRYWLPEVRLALDGGSASAGSPSDPPSAQAISLTVQRIVEAFTTKTQFTSVYPQALYRQEGETYFRYSHDLSQAGSPIVRGAAVSKALFDEHMASLAKALVEGIVKTSASEATKLAASADIQAALGLGSDWTIGKVIYTVFGNLAAKPLSDPIWGGTAKQFANQVAVAKYYTDHLSLSQDDVGVLRAIMAPVNHLSDVSSPEAMASLIGIGLLADPGG
jgi:Ca2+-binding RTX toxin-like protein